MLAAVEKRIFACTDLLAIILVQGFLVHNSHICSLLWRKNACFSFLCLRCMNAALPQDGKNQKNWLKIGQN